MDALGTMKRACLKRLLIGDAFIPASWATVEVYEALVSDGTAAPVVNVSEWLRGFTITKAGRDFIAPTPGAST